MHACSHACKNSEKYFKLYPIVTQVSCEKIRALSILVLVMILLLKPLWAVILLLIGLIGQLTNQGNCKKSMISILDIFFDIITYAMVILPVNHSWAEILPLIGLIGQLTN